MDSWTFTTINGQSVLLSALHPSSAHSPVTTPASPTSTQPSLSQIYIDYDGGATDNPTQNEADPIALQPEPEPAGELESLRDLLANASTANLYEIAQRLLDHATAITLNSDMRITILEQMISQLTTQLNNASASFTSRSSLDRQRFEVELSHLRLQANALVRKLVQGGSIVSEDGQRVRESNESNTRGVYAIYEGVYALEDMPRSVLKKENALLKSDVKFLRRRLACAEEQATRIESELRRHRSLLLTAAPLIALDTEIILPSTSSLLPPFSSSPPNDTRKSRLPLMGNAESEHLLLAGRRLSHLRRIHRVPLSAAISQQAHEIVGLGRCEQLTGTQRLANFDKDRIIRAAPPLATAPVLPEPPTTPRRLPVGPPSGTITPTITSPAQLFAGVGILNLLEAAAQQDPSLQPFHSSTVEMLHNNERLSEGMQGEAKRRRKHSVTFEPVDLNDSPPAQLDWASALDVLAEQASQTFPSSSAFIATTENMYGNGWDEEEDVSEIDEDEGEDYDEPPIVLALPPALPTTQTLTPPSTTTPASTTTQTRGAVSSTKPAKIRSNYQRWEPEEDELLVRAIIEHGKRWDAVASSLPSRSYHQVRQRFLRGFKGGEGLPQTLEPYYALLKRAVTEYDVAKKKHSNVHNNMVE